MDKQQLKEEVGKLNLVVTEFEADGMCYMDRAVSVTQVYDLIDHLDEPEVLSHEWIDKNKESRINNLRKRTKDDVVPVDKLQNLLVLKQELSVEEDR